MIDKPLNAEEIAIGATCRLPGDFAHWLERRRKKMRMRPLSGRDILALQDDEWDCWRGIHTPGNPHGIYWG